MKNKLTPVLVIIFFHPDEKDLNYVRKLGERYEGYIIDNSEKECLPEQVGHLTYICNHQNLGIAEAQNIALQKIIDDNRHSHVILFDQDSRVEIDYPEKMVEIYEQIKKDQPHLALLGPTVVHKDSGDTYQSVIHKDQYLSQHFILRRDVIASGACISLSCLKDVGINDSDLFIDYVDFEWCWRAERKGLVNGITDEINIYHQVGQKELKFPGGYRVILSSPFRYFYQYRNYIWLCRRNYVPLQWKIANGIKLTARFLYFPLFVKGGKECWKFMKRGISEGMKR